MFDFLHVLMNRRTAQKPIDIERRKKMMFPRCREANRALKESIEHFDDAITRAIRKRK